MANLCPENLTSHPRKSKFFLHNGSFIFKPWEKVQFNNVFFCFLLAIQSEKDLQTELQIKQRELLELKKRKLELELAATAKQLGLAVTTTAVVPTTIIDPAKMINQSDLTETYTAKRVAPVMPVVPKIQVPSLPVTSVGIFCL